MNWRGRRTFGWASVCLAVIAVLFGGHRVASHPHLTHDAQALPNGPAPAGVFRFVALGDTGTGKKAQFEVAERLADFHAKRPYDTVLMLGDNIYQSGKAADLEKKFAQPYAPLLKEGVKFYPVLGNHDVRQGRDAQVHYALFNMGGQSYYSFVKGSASEENLVAFFALDSTVVNEAQLRWLEQALTATTARWKIVYLHHPLYSSGKAHGSDTKLRVQLEPLLVRHHVTAVLAGHEHFYERIVPQQGIYHFISGAGGQLRRGDLRRNTSLTAAGNDQVNSFMFFEVQHERIQFWAIGASGEVLDQGSITQVSLKASP